MKYFTKEWYKKMQHTCLYAGLKVNNKAEEFSEDFYLELYTKAKKRYIKDLSIFTDYKKFKKNFLENIDEHKELKEEDIKQEFLNSKEKIFLNMPIEEHFNYLQNDLIEEYKTNIPENILNRVKDIRVLALGCVSSEVYNLLKEYSATNIRFVKEKFREYAKVEEEQFKNESIPFVAESFHDCFVLDVIKEKIDLVIKLDNEPGFTDKTKIVFKDYNIILDENIKETHWLYNEVYKNKNRYEVHILTAVNDCLKELIIECENIIIK